MLAPELPAEVGGWTLARFGFLRLLGVAASAAFLVLWNHGQALTSARGLTPIAETMGVYARHLSWWESWRAPTLFWLGASDGFQRALVGAGLVAGVLLTLGIAPRAASLVVYVVFLSFASTDRIVDVLDLRWFNWPADNLLLECAFLGIFLAPRGAFPGLAPAQPVARYARWFAYWIAFRLFFGPGMAKLLSTDPAWRELTALRSFYLMMPSPAPAAPTLHEAPMAAHNVLTLATLVFEVLGPFAFFLPGRPRRVAACAGLGLALGIHLSGNFRWLIVLCVAVLVLMLDDRWLLARMPQSWIPELRRARPGPAQSPPWRRACLATAAAVLVAGGAVSLSHPCRIDLGRVPGMRAAEEAVRAFGLGASYSMFAGMPSDRPGLVVQGTRDGVTWLDYETLGAPSHERSAPRRVAPYADHLGFALWATSRPPREKAPKWLRVLQRRLLEGDPACRALFSVDPFDGAPPQAVRVARYDFRFAPRDERREGTWWVREWIDEFVPARGLEDFSESPH